MSATLITNIGELTTNVGPSTGSGTAGDPCGTMTDAAILVDGGRIVWVGASSEAEGVPLASPLNDRWLGIRKPPVVERGAKRRDETPRPDLTVVDAEGRAVIPGFVDSHTHLVFAGDRADEFEARMAGTPYAAGGIRRTVAATRAATDDELRRRLAGLVAELRAQGTTTFEVKTGYGLTVRDEERLARLAHRTHPSPVPRPEACSDAQHRGQAPRAVSMGRRDHQHRRRLAHPGSSARTHC